MTPGTPGRDAGKFPKSAATATCTTLNINGAKDPIEYLAPGLKPLTYHLLPSKALLSLCVHGVTFSFPMRTLGDLKPGILFANAHTSYFSFLPNVRILSPPDFPGTGATDIPTCGLA